jgi:hypothetical protein
MPVQSDNKYADQWIMSLKSLNTEEYYKYYIKLFDKYCTNYFITMTVKERERESHSSPHEIHTTVRNSDIIINLT